MMFSRAQKNPLALQDQVKKEMDKLKTQGIIEPVKPDGGINASHVVWQRKKDRSLRLCADYKVHVNTKTMTDDYRLPDTETLFHKMNEAKSFAKSMEPDCFVVS